MYEIPQAAIDQETLDRLSRVQIESSWAALREINSGFRDNVISGLKCLRPDKKMVGLARTQRWLPMRPDLGEAVAEWARNSGEIESLQFRAAESTKPGEVMVIDSGGPKPHACWTGDIIVEGFIVNGGIGYVTDGTVRDLSAMLKMDIPMYIGGAHPGDNINNVGMEMNIPIRCGGVSVVPGDVLVGDVECVLVIPSVHAEKVSKRAAETDHLEEFYRDLIRSKRFSLQRVYGEKDPEVQDIYEEYKAENPVQY